MIVVDAVCRMNVETNETNYSSVYRGIKYYFCAAPCKKEFDEYPKDYVSRSHEGQVDEHSHDVEIQENKKDEHIESL